jgi:hypothetical protein
VKVVGLGECGTHALIDAQIGSIRQGERELADPLARCVEADMLVLADRGFFSYELCAPTGAPARNCCGG